MTAAPRKKLIEVSIPLEAINKASKKQKAPKGYPTALHKYWAQRPLAACRAVLFAQLVDDPSAWPDRFLSEEAQDEERIRLHKVIEALVPWEASDDEDALNAARWEIARSAAWGRGEEPPTREDPAALLAYIRENVPPIYDPFSGSGSIPLEAQRLGLRAYGSDLNPVAVLIGKALVEIPPNFAGLPPVNPASRAERKRGGAWQGQGTQGLAEDVRFYGRWMQEEASRRVGHLYPNSMLPDGSEAPIIAWLWARTVRSPDPAMTGAMVPLVSSYMLSTKEGRKTWLKPVVDPAALDGYRFAIETGHLSKAQEDILKSGTKAGRGSNFSCILSGAAIGGDYVKNEGASGRIGTRLIAVVAQKNRKRIYIEATPEQERIARMASPDCHAVDIPLSRHPQYMGCVPYGIDTVPKLFTSRQITALLTLAGLVQEAREAALLDAIAAGMDSAATPLHAQGSGASAYADAVATYLAFIVDRAADYGSTLSTWLTDDNAIRGTFGRQALPMTWDFCEGNYFGESSAALSTIIKTISDVVAKFPATVSGSIKLMDAAKGDYPDGVCIINTDPPYYDNIPYADLSDFFYVWLRHSLGALWPDLFRRIATPKDAELVADVKRHGGRQQAYDFFMDGMGQALSLMGDAASDHVPLVIYYAFKQAEASDEGVTSAGWASFLQSIVDAGLSVDGTWPVRTESAGRMRGNLSNALASSIVLVCRKRNPAAPVATRGDLVRALRKEMPGGIAKMRKAGVGPVDMQQSVIGPGMGVFTRFAKVLEDDDSAMPVKTALSLINRVWDEIENELTEAFDAPTQVALAWFATYGFDARPSGELIVLANAKNIPLATLFSSGVFQDLRGKAGLVARDDLPADWSPATDKETTIWECVQHTIRVLNAEDGGAEAAAGLVAQMGQRAEDARALAYRLFEIATQKGWASEALIYNALAQEWPRLAEMAPEVIARKEMGAPQLTLL
jgi:putative DNA methylase